MAQNDETQGSTPAQPVVAPVKKRFYKTRWFMAGAFALTGFAGFALGKAAGFRSHWNMVRGMDSTDMNARAEYRINRMLTKIDATAEQKARITTLVQSAMGEMQPVRQSFREGRVRLAAALSAPVVDRAAVEALRLEQLRKTEMLSRKMQDTLLAVADILSPAQRAQLAERWQSRRWRG